VELADRLQQGDVRALSRACRVVDDRLPGHRELLSRVHARSRRGWVLGITGGAGVGKSTLTDGLVARLRQQGERVGVVAVDPSSPFHGGALLGDRIRLQRHFLDTEVFIRSLATRGAHGGLSRSAGDVVSLLRAWGAGVTLIETVGVGQDELDVCSLAHTTVVVVAPGLGDSIQAMKAGLVETADLFVVNKADREGADRAVADLEAAIDLRGGGERPLVLSTVATSGQGLGELETALLRHRDWLAGAEGQSRCREREHAALSRFIAAEAASTLVERHGAEVSALAQRVQDGALDPYAAAEELTRRLDGSASRDSG
jgi:LAO/AO transport system kinase